MERTDGRTDRRQRWVEMQGQMERQLEGGVVGWWSGEERNSLKVITPQEAELRLHPRLA